MPRSNKADRVRLTLLLVRLFGVIVPRRLRDDWRQEWEAELRHRELLLADWEKLNWKTRIDLFRRSIGAFRDAIWLQQLRLEDEMFQDLRYGARMLIRDRFATAAAVIALGLGIGANTAVFSVVNTVLLRPLPYQNSDRMVVLWGNFLALNAEHLRAKAAEYVDYRDQTESFEEVAAFNTTDFNLTGGQTPERIAGAYVTANLFRMLGARPSKGALFLPFENQPANQYVVVVGHRFWQQHLNGEADVIGLSVTLNDQTYTIVGVMPPEFQFPHQSFNFAEPAEFWVPLTISQEQLAKRQRPFYLNVIALLKGNVSLAAARAEMDALGHRFEEQYQGYLGPNNTDSGWRITVTPLREQIVGNIGRALLVLIASVALVLLIACANAANLLLMRASVRQRELAIRAALGASRLRLIRQLLTESLLIAALSAVVGLLLAWSGIHSLIALSSANLPRLNEITVDMRVVMFTIGIAVLTAFVVGIGPALRASKPDLQYTLKDGGATATSGHQWTRNLIVVCEITIAMVLLAGAGLMLKSFLRLQRESAVLEVNRLLSAEIALPSNRYAASQSATFYQTLLNRIRALPGVQAAALSTIQPLSGIAINDPFSIEGRPLDLNNPTSAGWQLVTPDFFRTMGIGFVAGRDFTENDNADSPRAVIINESMARRYFPDEDPIGKRMTLGVPGPENPWQTIVGVVKDIPHRSVESTPEPDWYLSYLCQPRRDVFLMVRTAIDPAQFSELIRNEVAAVDKDQPITAIKPLSEVIATTTAPRRFNTLMLTIFAVVALTLATVGVYGVISYSVTQRRQEIGIRMALGARSGEVVRLVVKHGMRLTVLGIACGIVATIAGGRAISALLYETTPTDLPTLFTISALFTIVGLLASYIPARRASKVDPLTALRHG